MTYNEAREIKFIIMTIIEERIPREAMPLAGTLVGALADLSVEDAGGLLDSETIIGLVEGAGVFVVLLVALGVGNIDETVAPGIVVLLVALGVGNIDETVAPGICVLGAADTAVKELAVGDDVVPAVRVAVEGIGEVVMDTGAGDIVMIDVSIAVGLGEVVGTTSMNVHHFVRELSVPSHPGTVVSPEAFS
jgi:hypothetical protein